MKLSEKARIWDEKIDSVKHSAELADLLKQIWSDDTLTKEEKAYLDASVADHRAFGDLID